MCMAWQAMRRLCYRDPKTCLPSSLAIRCAREGEIGNEYRGMMTFDRVIAALRSTGVQAEVLNEIDSRAIVIRVLERLGVDVTSRAPWDQATSEGRQRPDGWELIPKYVGTNQCLMFLEGARSIWKFSCGADLLRVLEDCPALEIYVCDEEASYLLCSNHHDFVVGWGTALPWVARC
ncbi:hypothetical protein ABIB81_003037 [Bradyrhizobium sp. I1.7.5]